MVNIGGFSATILAALLGGGVLELLRRTGVPGFRFAFGRAAAVQLAGTAAAAWWWLRVRALMLDAQAWAHAGQSPKDCPARDAM